MNTTNDTHAVLLEGPHQLQQGVLADVLSKFKKIPFHDGAHLARLSWGFVAESLSLAEAENLVTLLRKSGLNGVIKEQTDFPALPSAVPIASVQFSNDYLSFVIKNTSTVNVSWAKLKVIAAAAFKTSTRKEVKVQEGPSAGQKLASAGIMMATGLPISIGPKKQVVVKQTDQIELLMYLDLMTLDPWARYRVDAAAFDFSFLKERMEMGGPANFKIFVTDLTKKAPNARRNKGTEGLLSNVPVAGWGYQSLADLDRECHWLQCLC